MRKRVLVLGLALSCCTVTPGAVPAHKIEVPVVHYQPARGRGKGKKLKPWQASKFGCQYA